MWDRFYYNSSNHSVNGASKFVRNEMKKKESERLDEEASVEIEIRDARKETDLSPFFRTN